MRPLYPRGCGARPGGAGGIDGCPAVLIAVDGVPVVCWPSALCSFVVCSCVVLVVAGGCCDCCCCCFLVGAVLVVAGLLCDRFVFVCGCVAVVAVVAVVVVVLLRLLLV